MSGNRGFGCVGTLRRSLLRRGLPAGPYPAALNSRWPAAMRGQEKLAEHYDRGLWCGAVRDVGVEDVAAERVQVEVSAAVAEPVLFPRPAGHMADDAGESAHLGRVAR